MMKKENDTVNIMKLVLSLVIVAIHTQLLNGKIYPFARIAVPLFFMLSSWLFFEKYEHNEKALKVYMKRNLELYLFWFVMLLPVTYLSRDYFQESVGTGFLRILKDFLFGSTFLASWYIMASVIAVFVICILDKKLDNKCLFGISIILYLFCLLTSNYEFLIRHSQVGKILFGIVDKFGKPYNNFCVGIFWMTVGKILVDNKHEIFRRLNKHRKIWLCIALFLLWGEDVLSKRYVGNVIDNDCYIMLLPVCILIFIMAIVSKISFPDTKRMRQLSTIIYCSHLSVVVVLRHIFTYMDIVDKYHILLFLSSVVVTVVGGWLILSLEKKINILKYAF